MGFNSPNVFDASTLIETAMGAASAGAGDCERSVASATNPTDKEQARMRNEERMAGRGMNRPPAAIVGFAKDAQYVSAPENPKGKNAHLTLEIAHVNRRYKCLKEINSEAMKPRIN